MADQTVRIDGVDAPSRVAFEMAKFLWYGAEKRDPKNTEEARQFLRIVSDCTYALKGAEQFENTKL